MQLTTIADLKQPAASKAALIERAMQLGPWYNEFKETDNSSYKYEVDIGGEKERAAGIHASEISNCKRLMVYSIQGAQRKSVSGANADGNMRMRFSIGHAVHAMVQNEMHRMAARFNGGLAFEDEVRINPSLGGAAKKWGMHSSCDGVFTFLNQGDPYLRVGFEIKTASGLSFPKMAKPDKSHLEQTCLYMKALDLPLMWIFYYNKSNSNWTGPTSPHLFQFDEHLWTKTLEPRFSSAIEQARTGNLPPREEGRHCNWCPFAWTCNPSNSRRRAGTPSGALKNPGALRPSKP